MASQTSTKVLTMRLASEVEQFLLKQLMGGWEWSGNLYVRQPFVQ